MASPIDLQRYRSRSLADGVALVAMAELPTVFGSFRIAGFENRVDGHEHVAILHGDVEGVADLPVRLHSECLTGDAFGSLRCDCRDQLHAALELVAAQPAGMVVYLRQEGRGIGITNKIRAYALQDRGLDTVDANVALGFPDDTRDYRAAAAILAHLGVPSVRLITNNPDKMRQLGRHGLPVTGRIPHVMAPTAHNRAYLETKARRSGHLLPTGS